MLGALLLAKLGLLQGTPACTDTQTQPWLEQAGVRVLDQPFHARGNVATAGGCLGAQNLSAWLMARLADIGTATKSLHYIAPVGEKEEYVSRMLDNVLPHLAPRAA